MRPLVLVTLLLLPGCFTVKFYNGDLEAAGAERDRAHHLWTHSLFWGLLPITRVDLSICDDGVKKMRSQIGGLGLLASWLTVGLWTPMHVKLVCAEPTSGQPQPEPTPAGPEPEPVEEVDGDTGAPQPSSDDPKAEPDPDAPTEAEPAPEE